MTKRPTTTTALSANFQASNALPPLLRMQQSRAPSPDNPCSHAASCRSGEEFRRTPAPVSFNGSDSHRTVRAVFCFFAANLPPPSSLFLTRRSNYRRHRHCHLSVGAAQQPIRQKPLPSPSLRTRNSRERHPIVVLIAKPTQRGDRKWGHWARNAPLIRDFPQLFRASPRAQSNAPRQHPRSVRPTATLRAKTPSALRFFAFRFASLAIPPYLCADTCPQNFAPSVVKWPWLGFFSSPCCRNWW